MAYTVKIYKNDVLESEIPNLSIYEAYQAIKPPYINPHNDRWHIMMYHAVLERIDLNPEEPLLVAWEEPSDKMDSFSKYIQRS
jgi:hypothetical protein